MTPGTHVFRVVAADTRGAVGLPSRTVRVRVRHSAPSIPGRLRIGRVTDTSVELGWGPARKRSSPIAGYRILRNGVPVGQVASMSTTIGNLAPATGYKFAIAAVDRWGYAGPSTVAQTTTAMPPPTQGKLHAFLLATTDESFVDLQRHYRQIGTVYPTYFDCRSADAGIIGKEDPLVTRWAQMRKIVVMPRFNCQHGPTLNMMLRNPAIRERTLTNLVALVQQHGYDGINLDFEAGFETDRDVLTTLRDGPRRAVACARQETGRGGVGEVLQHADGPQRLLRLSRARQGRGQRVRDGLGLALEGLRARDRRTSSRTW